MATQKKIAFIFPGQGAQYCGMGKDFASQYSVARQTFEEADDLLARKLSKIAFEGPEDALTETRNSQTAIYVNSMAILRTLQDLFPILQPSVCAGLSLGEYTALTCAGYLPFEACLPIVQYRGQYMNEACEERLGVMAAVIGLSADEVEAAVQAANLPNDLWVANFNCPGQTVISGTQKGVEVGGELIKQRGAKRILPLQVHGAFHSGLMQSAADRLAPHIDSAPIQKGVAQLVMNVPGDFVSDLAQIKNNLVKQVVCSVRWEQGIRAMQREGVEVYIEIGCGKTLAGMNKRIGVSAPTISIDKVEDLRLLEEQLVVLTT
ncbi:MAG: ACP S-malonyltransferase [Chlamydiales bacterium]|nr:ACP S-malonyltransferase [Chlamydiales bacterium]